MPRPPKVTLATIAKAADLSVSAVSMAMRNDPSIPEKTRDRVQKIAKKLCYKPNPMIASLNEARAAKRDQSKGARIAYVCHQADLLKLDKNHALQQMYEGALVRADELGYGMDLIFQKDYAQNVKRMTQVLISRGIYGVVISPRPKHVVGPGFDWNQFAIAALGFRFSGIDRVVSNNFTNMQRTLETLQQMGYRRIGFCSGDLYNELNSRHMSGAYLEVMQEFENCASLPILYYDDFCEQRATQWMKNHRPDCVISSDWAFIQWLKKKKYRIPKDVGVVSACAEILPQYARIDFNPRQVGANAVSQVSQKLIHNERGVSDAAQLIMTPGSFVLGPSVCEQK